MTFIQLWRRKAGVTQKEMRLKYTSKSTKSIEPK